jgi:glycosyltransferase involved in cell wall biosynthesis
MISAITAVYNEETTIEGALRSVAGIVDEYCIVDSSTDGTPDIIRDVTKSLDVPFHYIYDRKIHAVDQKRLKAAAIAHGDWLLTVDGDQFFYKDRLTKAIDDLPEEDITLVSRCVKLYRDYYSYRGEWEYSPYMTFHPILVRAGEGLDKHSIDLIDRVNNRRLAVEKPLFVNVCVKSPERLFIREYYSMWQQLDPKPIDLTQFVMDLLGRKYKDLLSQWWDSVSDGTVPLAPGAIQQNNRLPYPQKMYPYVPEQHEPFPDALLSQKGGQCWL